MSWQCVACQGTNPPGTKFCGHCGARAVEDAGDVAQSVVDRIAELSTAPSAPGAAERGEERRLITVVFADISGFTPLADRLDAEEVAAAVDPILERMAGVIERYEGHVHQYAGDAVIAYFGAPVAHEDDAVRAVLAARDMHREVAEVVGTLPADVRHVQLHIGVNTGHVVTGFRGGGVRADYYALGDAVNTAQRLEAACPVGEVYVGELTKKLAAGALGFESVGDLTMKGKPEPVTVWRLVPDVTAAQVDSGGGMVGREAEFAAVAAALDAAAAGERLVLGMVGEPGVGKSRLLAAARDHAIANGMRWLDTRCLSYGAGLAYRPYLDLLHRMAGLRVGDPGPHVQERITALAAELGLQQEVAYLLHVAGAPEPGIADAVRHNAQALRARVQEALVAVVLAACDREPVVLAIEDVHWLDSASLDVTALLVARSAGRRCAVIATARPEGGVVLQRLAAEADGSRQLDISGLEPAAAHRLAAALVGGDIDSDAMDRVLARTGGNALFVQELVRSLLEAGAFVRTPGGWTLAAGGEGLDVPSTVESVLAARIDMLPAEVADVLTVASVVGRHVRLPLLQGLVRLPAEALDAAVDVLVERQFIDRVTEAGEQRLVFHHALVADVAYSRLLRRRRRELHRRLLETALRLYGAGDDSIDLLARNAYLGGMGADGLPYIVRAAERASALYANAQALTFLEQAVEIVEADAQLHDRLPELLMLRGELLERIGRFDDAAQAFHRAYAGSGAATAALAEATALYKKDRLAECTDRLDALEGAHPDLPATLRSGITVLRARVMTLRGDAGDAVRLLTRGWDELVAAGGAGTLAEADILVARGRFRCVINEYADGMEDLQLAARMFEGAGDLQRLATALRALGGAQTDADQIDAGIATLLRALDVARQVGHAEEIGAASLNLGWAYCAAERLEEALVCTEEAKVAFASMGLLSGVANARVNRCDILLDLGRLDEAEAEAVETLELAFRTDNVRWRAGAIAIVAEVALRRGDHPTAVAKSEESIRMFEEMGDADHAELGRKRIAQAREAAESAS